MTENTQETTRSAMMAKGRIAVLVILVGTIFLTAIGVITNADYIEVIKLIGTLWLGAEAGARIG